MIIKETTLRSKIRDLLLEERVYKIKELLEDIAFYRDFEEGELEQVEQRLRSNWDRGYSKFSQVIKKDVINTQEPIDHILDAIDSFMPYYSKVGPQMQSKIGRGELTSSNLRSYVEAQSSDKLNRTRTDQRIKCRKQVSIQEGQECKDFKVIHADTDWVVVYPKTMLGSMSWAVGLADGSEEVYEVDSNGKQVGRVGWCTAAYTNNRFPMYAGNLHMYYFVKNRNYNISDRHRRLCITLSKNKNTGEVKIHYGGNATVDANNGDFPEKRMSGLVSSKIIEKIKADAASKKATSLSDVASKVTLPMVKQDIENLKEDPDLLTQQLKVYAEHAKDIEVIRFFASYENVNVKQAIARRSDLPGDIVEQLAKDKSPFVRRNISSCKDLHKDLVVQLAQDESEDVRIAIARRSDLPEDLVFQLAQDEHINVRGSVLYRDNLPESVIRLFARDENPGFRWKIANRSDLPEDLVFQLAYDKDASIRSNIIYRKDLPEKIIKDLAKDKSGDVRAAIAKRSDLPEKFVKDLAKDKRKDVRAAIASNNNLDLSKDLIIQLVQDKSKFVRNSIAKRKDLPGDLIAMIFKNSSTPGNIIKNYVLEKSLVDEELSRYIDNDASKLSDRKDLKDVVRDGDIELLLAHQNISDKDLIKLYNKASLPLQYIILARRDLPSDLRLKYKPEMFTPENLEEKFGKYYTYEEEDINLVIQLLSSSRFVNPEVLDNLIYFDLFGDKIHEYDNMTFEIAPAIVYNKNSTPQLKKKILDHFNDVFNDFVDYYGPQIIVNMREYLEEFLTKNHPEIMRESRLLKSYINMLLN